MTGRRGDCRVHRPALLALAEHRERGPGTPAALEHLAICRSCEEEAVGIALTVAALRRAGATYRRLPVPATAAVLRVPPGAGHGRWAWRLQLGSLAAGAALAAIVVMPRAGPPTAPAGQASPHVITPVQAPGVQQWQAAERRLASSPESGPQIVISAGPGTLPPRYPDTMLRPWKEVAAPDATARVLEPR